MSEVVQSPAAGVVRVAAGEDCYGERRGTAISAIDFKVAAPDGSGLFVIEITHHARGGPARHLHRDQEEWFYVLEGAFAFEVDAVSTTHGPGDSLLVPRGVPHVWAFVGDGRGRLLITFTPAGSMEAFFRTATAAYVLPPRNAPDLFRAHGMEELGPPLPLPE